MCLLLLVTDLSNDAVLSYCRILGDLIPVNEKTCVISLVVAYDLKETTNLVYYNLDPLEFILFSHELAVLL